ncbi:MAG: sulfurtransferase [Pseudomonadaceae bacterium]|nr:sulfurtransferase [Pseudomonadaceae bacterium]
MTPTTSPRDRYLVAAEACTGNDIVLFDCRSKLGEAQWGRRAWLAGHIPGALHLDLDRDLAGPPGPGGRHPLPDPNVLANRLGELGASDASRIVVYDDVGGAMAARAWWCVRWLGHDNVAMLDGGLNAWELANPKELQAGEQTRTPATFTRRDSLTKTISASELAANLGHQSLIDARTKERFNGEVEPIDAVAGHIPGATCLPFQGNLNSVGRFKSSDELAARFADLADPVIAYCGSGVTAAHNLFALRLAGRDEGVLYPGSWSEWLLDASRPRQPAA